MVRAARTASEERFETYLTARGVYTFEHEPDLGIDKRPDYLVSREGASAACEVKEFTTTVIRDRLEMMGGTAMMSDKQVFGTVRAQVDAAARQLKPLAGRGLPLVVVLSNPHGADVSLAPEDVIFALYGNPGMRIPIDTAGGGQVGPAEAIAGRDGALTAKHAYIGAVVTLHARTLEQDWADEEVKRFSDVSDFFRHAREAREKGLIPEGSRRWVHVFRTVAATQGDAAALPDDFFDGPEDHVWAPNDSGAYVQVH